MIKEIYKYRGLIAGIVKREFESRYKNSLLGATWTIIQPLSMIFVYTIIFSQIMRAKLPNIDSQFAYSIYICSGILLWSLFSEICYKFVNIFIENANLIKKINFPKICLAIGLTINSTINFIIIFSIFTLFLLFSKNFPGIVFISITPVILVLITLAVGIGINIGILNVFFRDVGQLFSIIIQFWFWLTPIVYPISIIPENIQYILELNPMYPVIAAFQEIIVYNNTPDWFSLIYPAVFGIILCLLGLKIYHRHHGEMVDEL